MPGLAARNVPRLLRTVNHKQHASDEDHQDLAKTYPTPTSTDSTRSLLTTSNDMEQEEDINRDPESSDDEVLANGNNISATGFILPRRRDVAEDKPPKKAVLKKPRSAFSPDSTGSKRSQEAARLSSDGDEIAFSSQGSVKRPKSSYGGNIHAQKNFKKTYTNAKKNLPQTSREKQKLVQPRTKTTTAPQKPSKPKFKAPKSVGVFEFNGSEAATKFQPARTPGDTINTDAGSSHSLSPSLSSLSSGLESPELQAIEPLDLPAPKPYDPKVTCGLCGDEIDLFLKEAFEDEFSKGKQMSYKWQQRFCRYHKQHVARQIWEQRGYPEIDWPGLENRMRRLHPHLKNAMTGARPSHYRDLLSEKLKGRAKTALQNINASGGKRGTAVGYYGPWGEKAMADHIISHLSSNLRREASKDKLIAAAGVSGGVSGFVQAVLVPELAEGLIQQDMNVSLSRAREIIAESAELGELLYPDVDDKVTDFVDMSVAD